MFTFDTWFLQRLRDGQMAVPDSLQAPSWINSGATVTGGLDLLGLRLPVQTIGGSLLDGVTTVTP